MKIMITGGSGFVGTHLTRNLSIGGHKVTNLDLKRSIFQNDIKEHIVDIRDSFKLVGLKLYQDYDICIHLAALCKEPGYSWEEYFETNHVGTANTIALCEKLGISKIIFTSTMMVYQAGEVQRTENSITAPDTAYGISKLLAEKELEKWKVKEKGRELKIIRPAVVFGENENANFTRLYASLRKGFFPYIGRKSTVKSNIYVKELVSFISFLITSQTKNDIFNLAFPERHEMRKIVETFKRVFGFKAITPILPYRFMLLVSYFFRFVDSIGLKNPIHPRRIQKLYNSTHIYPESAMEEGYKFKYDLNSSLKDWEASNDPNL